MMPKFMLKMLRRCIVLNGVDADDDAEVKMPMMLMMVMMVMMVTTMMLVSIRNACKTLPHDEQDAERTKVRKEVKD